jgi:linoleoyl-CoA desaturase
MVWLINSKAYDLTEFMDKHPGGRYILEHTNNTGDITCLFESYHAFSNKKIIEAMMERYEIKEEPEAEPIYDMKLYNELAQKVKEHGSYNRSSIKATTAKQLFICVCCFLYAFISYTCILNINWLYNCFAGCMLGFLWIVIGFNMMHEGSHYALTKGSSLNLLCSRLWCGFGLWNGDIWSLHHVIFHHRFTGTDRDPDVYHLRPFYNKNNKKRRLKIPVALYPVVLFIFPGYYLGQVISYFMGYISGKVFGMRISTVRLSSLHIILVCLRIYLFYLMGLHATVMHMLVNNLLYGFNVLADHDTHDVLVENHYTGKDWLKLQVMNSANFLVDSDIYTYLFGGINYQIEHHLFPNMSSVHLKSISPIVREFCKEHDINYTVHNSIYEVMKQYQKSLKHFN